ncbi:MAG: L17 family ribosomal protein [Candidatus Shapirobacteria bacterium]|jgi:large subunit ribosomal protein L17
MKHRIFGKKLGRNHNERQALFKSLTKGMFISGYINTTEAKAKSVVSTVESLSNTIICKPELTAKRELFKILQDQTWVNNVFKTFKEVFGEQTSNFTKMTRIKRRYGDDALIVRFSFVKPIKFEQKKAEVKSEIKKIVKKESKEVKKPVKKVVKKIKKETK